MPALDTADSQFRALLGAAAIVIIVGGLRAVSEVLDPLLMAAIPLTTALRRAVMPATVASAPESTATESTAPALSPA